MKMESRVIAYHKGAVKTYLGFVQTARHVSEVMFA